MNFRFDQPLWLALIAGIIPMAAAALVWMRAMGIWRRWSAILLRLVLLGLIAGALAGAAWEKRTDRLAVVAVVDTSGSVRRFAGAAGGQGGRALEQVAAAIDSMAASAKRGPDDVLGVVAFDARAAAVVSPSRAKTFGRSLDISGAEGSNLAEGLKLAAAMIPPESAGRIVLFSDGNQTAGDAVAAAGQLAGASGKGRRRMPIDVVPLEYAFSHEVVVESVDAPPRAAAGSRVVVRVTLNATSEAAGTLRLLSDGKPVPLADGAADRRIKLAPGKNVELMEVELDESRVHRFAAIFEPDAGSDTLSDNNRGEAFTITPGKGSVLVVDGVGEGAGGSGGTILPDTLRRAGLSTSVVAPGGFPADLLGLQAYDMVVLENVPADALSRESQETLVDYVRDLGGGLVMIGGPQSFGAGGWRGTPIEPILPVRLELPDKLVTPEVAICFVLDNSGSMRRSVMGSFRSQQEIANESAALAIKSLDKRDLVGVIVFNTEIDVLTKLGPNSDAEATASKVRSILPNGGTNGLPALEEAGRQLGPVEAKQKHIIFLSDGRSMNPDQLPVVSKRLGERGIKVTTIAVGDEADLRTMEAMATNGNGSFYNVTNPHILPRVFAKAVRVARTPMVREVPFTPAIMPTGSPMTMGLSSPPPLGGLTLTQPRNDPTIVNAMLTPEGEPVLAHWNVELGQVVAFTSDAHRWASAWLDWPGYARLWTQIVRQASRVPASRTLQPTAQVVGDELVVRLEASDDNGAPSEGLSVPATVYTPTGERREIELAQSGPGMYEARVPVSQTGSYVALLRPRRGEKKLSPVITGATLAAGTEYRALRTNDALLERVAQAGSGVVVSLDEAGRREWFDRKGVPPQTAVIPVWPTLLSAALAVFLLDVATRRIAWDRYRIERPRRETPVGATQTTGLRSVKQRVDENAASAGLALSEADAERLRQAARDRRRAARLASAATASKPADQASSPTEETTSGDPAQDSSSLLAAKRRAREQFDEESGS